MREWGVGSREWGKDTYEMSVIGNRYGIFHVPYEICHLRFVLVTTDATRGAVRQRIEYRLQPEGLVVKPFRPQAGTLYAVP